MLIKDILIKYRKKIDSLDLELIISDSINKPREFVLAHPEFLISNREELKIERNIKRRIKNEPLAHILGHKEFFGLDFEVNKNVLVPRPETEQLVELVLKKMKTIDYPPARFESARRAGEAGKLKTIIIDVGTGSGNIIISLAKNLKRGNIFYGIDISKKSLSIAKKNYKKNKIYGEIKFLNGNLLEPIIKKNSSKKKILQPANYFITANLPYLDYEWKILLKNKESAGLKFEPKLALEGGEDGLDLYRKLARQIQLLKKENNNIYLFCEIGHLQKNKMKRIFYFAKKVDFTKDLAGKWRVLEAEI